MLVGAFSSLLKRQDHFADHGHDMGAIDPIDYENKARDFLSKPFTVDSSIEERTRSNGDVVRYDKVTNEFAVATSSGTIKTYFKPMMRTQSPNGAPPQNTHSRSSNYQYFLDESST